MADKIKSSEMNELVSWCKRRGVIYQASEIYGGFNGFWNYGPLGVELRKALKDTWWKRVVNDHDNVVGMDGALILHPRTWEASGHVQSFHDPMVDCKTCKARFRADHLDVSVCGQKPSQSPKTCGGELTEPRQFNLMFKTQVGAIEDSSAVAYLRPETAQAIFPDFKLIQGVARQRVPFGIAQIGKSFRNEVNPRNFIFRSREFEQMEMEFFCHPKESARWMDYWIEQRLSFYKNDLGIPAEKIRVREHEKAELAHYAARCVDVEYLFPFGWQELEGIADRGTYDLSRHMEFSGKDLQYFDDASKERYTPAVVETSAGVDRTLLAMICAHLVEEELTPDPAAAAPPEAPAEGAKKPKGEDNEDKRMVFKCPPRLAPVQVGVFPLFKKLAEPAQAIEKDLRREFRTQYDDAGAIGRRYRRQDEIGTPYCVTWDFDSEKDQSVTVRDRDSMKQDRVKVAELKGWLRERLFG